MSRVFKGASQGGGSQDGYWFNGVLLPEEPLWYMDSRRENGGTNGIIGVFGKSSYTEPMAYITPNGNNAVGSSSQRWHVDNVEQPQQPKGYNSTLSTHSINPAAGYMGISCDGEGYNLRNEILDIRGVLHPLYHGRASENAYQALIVGEPGYKRGISLGRVDTHLKTGPLTRTPNFGGGRRISLTTSHYTKAGDTGNATDGSMGYNRRAGILMLVEYRENYSGFRLHIWSNLSRKIGASVTDLDALLKECKADDNYRYVDYSTNNGGGYSGANDGGWKYDTVVVPCDDGTAWLMHRYGGGSYLYAFDGTAVTHKKTLGNNSSFTLAQGIHYNTKFQLSEDQSRVAIYSQYYRYLNGCTMYICETKSAVNFGFYQDAGTSNASRSIAPIGGPLFGMTNYTNLDGQTDGMQLRVIGTDTDPLTPGGVSLGGEISWINFHHRETSTNYSGAWLNRIYHNAADSTEYKEGLL